ncbi:phosphatase PAP2 family protein [Hartmannibacter diazotrophicus]|uniref:phosphatase PAP2 family protein n=1 Tax=Hartmannibacter diazotrophicus TaxID=1482074 RepID=UPI0012FD6E55|nr:phosphatase PAP2 family protein [Hartmannibacter diazotrophicus]
MFDIFVVDTLTKNSFKMLPMVVYIVYESFAGNRTDRNKNFAVFTLLGAFIALVVSRAIQDLSPHHPRPLYAGIEGFVVPFGVPPDFLSDWSSFPSDTAALAFALATAIWFVSRRMGLFFFFWSIVVVSFPRVYAGYHYPSDVFCGALLGIASTVLAHYLFTRRIENLVSFFASRYERVYMLFVVFCLFEVATVFGDLRESAMTLLPLLH